MNRLEKNYGLPTAIAVVVGIVIGSGVFFKAERVLVQTGGDLKLGILAWIIGGIIMLICAYVFGVMTAKYNFVNGVIDSSEQTVGPKYGYLIGWFFATIYYPSLVAVLAWLCANYTCVILGFSPVGGEAFVIASVYLVGNFVLNTFSVKLAGKFQLSTTIIKMIPLFSMGILGLFVGLGNGQIVENFTVVEDVVSNPFSAILSAVVATAFAYEGWIIATSINSEIRDSKKNLPRALILGTLVIAITYIFYYIGLSGAVDNSILMDSAEGGTLIAFENIFGLLGSRLLYVFVVISCLGTLNGIMMACSRGFYSLAIRDRGPFCELFKVVDPQTKMANNSSIWGLFLATLWLAYFFGANLTDNSWFGVFSFDSSELPIVTVYALYIPVFIMFIKKADDVSFFKRFVMPILALCCCAFMIFASFFAHGYTVFYYLIFFSVVMAIGYLFIDGRKSV